MTYRKYDYFDYYRQDGDRFLVVIDDKGNTLLTIAFKDIPDLKMWWLDNEDKYENEIWDSVDRYVDNKLDSLPV